MLLKASPSNQSEHEASTCSWHQARAKTRAIKIGFAKLLRPSSQLKTTPMQLRIYKAYHEKPYIYLFIMTEKIGYTYC